MGLEAFKNLIGEPWKRSLALILLPVNCIEISY